MKHGKRGLRREHTARMKRRARSIHPNWPESAKIANHLAVCSCWMCGNPRGRSKGSERLTLQERIADVVEGDFDCGQP